MDRKKGSKLALFLGDENDDLQMRQSDKTDGTFCFFEKSSKFKLQSFVGSPRSSRRRTRKKQPLLLLVRKREQHGGL